MGFSSGFVPILSRYNTIKITDFQSVISISFRRFDAQNRRFLINLSKSDEAKVILISCNQNSWTHWFAATKCCKFLLQNFAAKIHTFLELTTYHSILWQIFFSAKNVARNATKKVTHPCSLLGWLATKPNFSQWTVTTPYTQYWKWYVIGYDKNAIFANPLGVIFSSSEGCLKASPLWSTHPPKRESRPGKVRT